MHQLAVRHISFIYDTFLRSLEDISFTVDRGETVCVVGANGSGKSTLLQVIASALPPSTGEIIIEGHPQKAGEHSGKTGMVFQEPDNQFFMPTVWEDVAFGILKKGMKPEEAREQAIAALKIVEAADLAERLPHKISGGEKQRAALSSILIMEPEILLLDEPTAALDPKARKNIITVLGRLPNTKIIASHDLDMALDIASRIVFLDKGKIAADCPAPGLLLDEDFLQSIGLELPLSCTKRR
ncbi:MAG: energy-coupling factor ABC transporter ATP-binding protein [Treponema sp.]|jgi:cobalt/nickel transport system ATP-binding protein|nr:energy-coupling factor ABC transporter ATP-binding protein [Treponema sp.]